MRPQSLAVGVFAVPMISTENTEQLTRTQLLLYCAAPLVKAMVILPMFSVLPGFYAQYRGLDLIALGTALIASRVIDAVTDPMIGHLSDRTRSPLGARKPWFIGGSFVSALGVFFLFDPPVGITIWYYLIWSVVTLVGWSMMDITYSAWGNELVPQYNARTRMVGLRAIFLHVGYAIFLLAPIWLLTGKAEISPHVMRVIGWIFVFAMPMVAITVSFAVPSRPVLQDSTVPLHALMREIARNRPFWLFIAILIPSLMAIGANMGLGYLFITDYLQLGSSYSWLALPATLSGLVAVPLWLPVARRLGKHRAWALGLFIAALASLGIAFIPAGPQAQVPFFIVLTVFALATGANWVAPVSMLGDTVDYDELHSGTNKAGVYFAAYALLNKTSLAVASGMALFVVGMFGFKAGAPMDEHGRIGMLIGYAGLPFVFSLIAGFVALRFPLDEQRQTAIQKELEMRRSGERGRAPDELPEGCAAAQSQQRLVSISCPGE